MKQIPNIIAGLFFILTALLSLLFVPFKTTLQFCMKWRPPGNIVSLKIPLTIKTVLA